MNRHRAFLAAATLAAALALALALAPGARADWIRTLDLEVQEDVLAIEGEGDALVLKTAGHSIPAADLKEVRFPASEREPRPGPVRLFLSSGDELSGEVKRGTDARLTIETASLGAVEVPLDRVRAVAFPRDEGELRRFRKEALPLEAKSDLVFSRSWRGRDGIQEGMLEKIDERGVSFTTAGLGTVPLGPDKILGARVRQFGKPPAPPPGLRARLELACGSVVIGKLKSFRGGTFALDTAFKPGLEVRSAEARALSFLNGRIAYVSDLVPFEVEERGDQIDLTFKHRLDANVNGNPLKVDGKPYSKGLGVHAHARLAYRLDKGYVRFRATIGLDDEAREIARTNGTPGHVKFPVLVDGKPALGEAGITLSTSDPARPIDVFVGGADTLTLVAGFAAVEVPDCLARGAWADAALIKSK